MTNLEAPDGHWWNKIIITSPGSNGLEIFLTSLLYIYGDNSCKNACFCFHFYYLKFRCSFTEMKWKLVNPDPEWNFGENAPLNARNCSYYSRFPRWGKCAGSWMAVVWKGTPTYYGSPPASLSPSTEFMMRWIMTSSGRGKKCTQEAERCIFPSRDPFILSSLLLTLSQCHIGKTQLLFLFSTQKPRLIL